MIDSIYLSRQAILVFRINIWSKLLNTCIYSCIENVCDLNIFSDFAYTFYLKLCPLNAL